MAELDYSTESQQVGQRADTAAEVDRQRSWHIDRTIPLVLVLGIFVQTAGAFWWASQVTSKNAEQDEKIVVLNSTLTLLSANIATRNEQLAKLSENIMDRNERLSALSTKLDQVIMAYARGPHQ